MIGAKDVPDLRDHFAGLALMGLLAAMANDSCVVPNPEVHGAGLARDAYKLADAMLAERKREAKL